ncbi:hypothetical protein Pmani_025521 [Petrolisthes manimaculis]|uniref:Uncharacterized protein n=1 Tax=Petrolisthes manimaculis TaxID=1843537 RepID=A0AAE1P5F0_9EUCA|nr:hypothetical protein Pmani_025521 [Petrolisthes manimaculis]
MKKKVEKEARVEHVSVGTSVVLPSRVSNIQVTEKDYPLPLLLITLPPHPSITFACHLAQQCHIFHVATKITHENNNVIFSISTNNIIIFPSSTITVAITFTSPTSPTTTSSTVNILAIPSTLV